MIDDYDDMSREEMEIIIDRLEGWELVEFLQVPIEEVLSTALENTWINSSNLDDVLELAGLKEEDKNVTT